MNFKKLALAAAVAVAPMSALALEPMQDEAMSAVTGQDGINIGLATDVVAGLKVHDKDGIDGTVGNAGALVISGFSITRALGTDEIELVIDTDDGGGTAPYLNVGVNLPDDLTVNLGSVTVASSQRDTGAWTTDNTTTEIMNLGELTLGATTLNIQLGNEPQGNMIALNTTITNGISLSGFSVTDAGGTVTGGTLSTDLQVVDNNGTDLTVDTGIDISADGLVIGLSGIGGATGIDVRMADLAFGGTSAASIGDVELIGLQLSGNVNISGH
ncbi:MAG: DUF6160 family protein [Alloalcanivorax sp.]